MTLKQRVIFSKEKKAIFITKLAELRYEIVRQSPQTPSDSYLFPTEKNFAGRNFKSSLERISETDGCFVELVNIKLPI